MIAQHQAPQDHEAMEAFLQLFSFRETVRAVVLGAVIALVLWLSGAAPFKAIVIGAILCGCMAAGVGRRTITRTTVVLVGYALACWIDFAPAPREIATAIAKLTAWACSGSVLR